MRVWTVVVAALALSAGSAAAQGTVGVSATIESAISSPDHIQLGLQNGSLRPVKSPATSHSGVLYRSEVTVQQPARTEQKGAAPSAPAAVTTRDDRSGELARPVMVAWTVASNS